MIIFFKERLEKTGGRKRVFLLKYNRSLCIEKFGQNYVFNQNDNIAK